MSQWPFQQQHTVGRSLNVGCGDDGGDLKRRGAINVDLHAIDPGTGHHNEVDVIADARALPFKNHSFDRVILGELLEHLGDHAVWCVLEEARRLLVPAGSVVITLPEDHRGCTNTPSWYAPGIATWHEVPVTEARWRGWLQGARLEPFYVEPIHYDFGAYGACDGWGILAVEI